MQQIREILTMSPAAKESFEREERARWRDAERMAARGAGAGERVAAAEAKRLRKQQRNLVHCS